MRPMFLSEVEQSNTGGAYTHLIDGLRAERSIQLSCSESRPGLEGRRLAEHRAGSVAFTARWCSRTSGLPGRAFSARCRTERTTIKVEDAA